MNKQPITFLTAIGISLGFAMGSQAASEAGGSPTLAPIQMAHTFAQINEGDKVATLLVVAITPNGIRAIDLSAVNKLYSRDAFRVIEGFSASRLDRLAAKPHGVRSFSFNQLIGVGPEGLDHIAAGTNYPEHGKETGVADAFLFPKLAPAGDPKTSVATGPGVLLDYEVEVCARFDREIRSLDDFDSARKGLFLCGDFSDRATLVKNVDLTNVTSGDGFPDAKSGSDRFPVGQLLVVPREWKTFVPTLTISTHVDGRQRQSAHARDMIKDLRTIVDETLDEAESRTWLYQGKKIPMIRDKTIRTGSAVLTGTGEGVVFQEPSQALMEELKDADGRKQQFAILTRYLKEEEAKRIYLQPGQVVKYGSNYLGWIEVNVIENKRSQE